MEFYIFVYKACAVSLYTILVREVDGRFVTLFFNMSQNDLKRPNRILLIFSAIHIKSLAFRFATPSSTNKLPRHPLPTSRRTHQTPWTIRNPPACRTSVRDNPVSSSNIHKSRCCLYAARSWKRMLFLYGYGKSPLPSAIPHRRRKTPPAIKSPWGDKLRTSGL